MTGRWPPATLGVQLTAWHVAVTLVVLAVYAAAVLVIVTRNASEALDARLRSDFRWAAGMAERDADGGLSWFEGDPWSEESPWLQVWSTDGGLIYRTAVARRLPAPGSEALLARADGRIVALPSEPAPFRVLVRRTTIAGEPVVVQVGRSEALMRQEIAELALVLLAGLPLGVAAAGVGGYCLARRALRPLARMTDRARAITASRLADRLPIHNPRDELGRLAAVFNETLGRLESSFLAMRRFTANVSHELRTPLTAIRSVGEVGLRGARDAAAYRATIGSMLEEAERLSGLVDHLLTVSRADGGGRPDAARIDLAGLAGDVAAHLGVLAEEKGQSLVVVRRGRPTCRGDRMALRQALINLVDNAIKYTPAGGRIEIRALAADADAVVEVRDNGPGVADRDAPRLFERLYRAIDGDASAEAPAAGAGAGLGLALARRAVEANAGRLGYEPADDAGSIFRIVLPAEGAAPAGAGA